MPNFLMRRLPQWVPQGMGVKGVQEGYGESAVEADGGGQEEAEEPVAAMLL